MVGEVLPHRPGDREPGAVDRGPGGSPPARSGRRRRRRRRSTGRGRAGYRTGRTGRWHRSGPTAPVPVCVEQRPEPDQLALPGLPVQHLRAFPAPAWRRAVPDVSSASATACSSAGPLATENFGSTKPLTTARRVGPQLLDQPADVVRPSGPGRTAGTPAGRRCRSRSVRAGAGQRRVDRAVGDRVLQVDHHRLRTRDGACRRSDRPGPSLVAGTYRVAPSACASSCRSLSRSNGSRRPVEQCVTDGGVAELVEMAHAPAFLGGWPGAVRGTLSCRRELASRMSGGRSSAVETMRRRYSVQHRTDQIGAHGPTRMAKGTAMGVSLSKGGNVSLTKAAPGLKAVAVGLGWDVRSTTGTDFDLDASALGTGREPQDRSPTSTSCSSTTPAPRRAHRAHRATT